MWYVCDVLSNHIHHHLFKLTTLSPLDLWTEPARVIALLARWTEKLTGLPQAGYSAIGSVLDLNLERTVGCSILTAGKKLSLNVTIRAIT